MAEESMSGNAESQVRPDDPEPIGMRTQPDAAIPVESERPSEARDAPGRHVHCRPYLALDFAMLYAVEEACFTPPLRFDRPFMRRLLSSRRSSAWVAEDEGQIVGFAIAQVSGGARPLSAYLHTIEVLPDLRRRGVARELLGGVERSVVELGAEVLDLHVDSTNSDAILLYRSRGFVALAREENFYPQGHAAIFFRKKLCAIATE